MADKRLQLVITARNLASSTLKGFRRQFDRVKDAVRSVARAAAAATAAIAGATAAIAKLASRGNRVVNVERAFTRATGDLSGSLKTLRQSTNGLISDFDLMVGFNQALALGAAENVDQFAQLSETALALGRALGVDASRALESLTIGIGRQSRLLLDNLGLLVSVEQANKDYAAALGIATSELTASQQKEAFRIATLEAAEDKVRQLGGVTINAADGFTRIRNAVTNVVDAFGVMLAQSEDVSFFLGEVANIADDIATIAKSENQSLITEAFKSLGRIAGNAFAASFLEALGSVLVGIDEAIFGALEKIPGLGNIGDKIITVFGAIGEGLRDIASEGFENINAEIELLNNLATDAERRIAAMRAAAGGEAGGGGGGRTGPDVSGVTAGGVVGPAGPGRPESLARITAERVTEDPIWEVMDKFSVETEQAGRNLVSALGGIGNALANLIQGQGSPFSAAGSLLSSASGLFAPGSGIARGFGIAGIATGLISAFTSDRSKNAMTEAHLRALRRHDATRPEATIVLNIPNMDPRDAATQRLIDETRREAQARGYNVKVRGG